MTGNGAIHAQSLPISLREFKGVFDPVLAEWLHRKAQQSTQLVGHSDLSEIIQNACEIVLGGGKRGRPFLIWLAYITEGGEDAQTLLPALVGMELFHAFALMHDDIIDHASERHGVETVHTRTARNAEVDLAMRTGSDRSEYGRSQALLAGDLMFSWAQEAFTSAPAVCAAPEALRQFYLLVNEVILGQMIDVHISVQKQVASRLIAQKTELKTARYSFVRPLLMGAVCARGEALAAERAHWYESIGFHVGMAFQLQDDLLDIVGDEELGKPTMQDVAAGQHTVFTQHVFEHGDKKDQDRLLELMGRTLTPEAVLELKDIFERSGAIVAGGQEISHHYQGAKKLLSARSFPTHIRSAWAELLELMENRSK